MKYPFFPIIMEVENGCISNSSYLSKTAIFHFHDCGRKGISLTKDGGLNPLDVGKKTKEGSFSVAKVLMKATSLISAKVVIILGATCSAQNPAIFE